MPPLGELGRYACEILTVGGDHLEIVCPKVGLRDSNQNPPKKTPKNLVKSMFPMKSYGDFVGHPVWNPMKSP